MGGEEGLEVVAGGGADEVAPLGGEDVGDGAGVVSADGFASQDNGAGVHLFRAQAGLFICCIDDTAEGLVVYALPAGSVGGEVDGREVEGLTLGDDEAAGQLLPEPAEQEAREDDLGGGGANVDADTGEGNSVDLPERVLLFLLLLR